MQIGRTVWTAYIVAFILGVLLLVLASGILIAQVPGKPPWYTPIEYELFLGGGIALLVLPVTAFIHAAAKGRDKVFKTLEHAELNDQIRKMVNRAKHRIVFYPAWSLFYLGWEPTANTVLDQSYNELEAALKAKAMQSAEHGGIEFLSSYSAAASTKSIADRNIRADEVDRHIQETLKWANPNQYSNTRFSPCLPRTDKETGLRFVVVDDDCLFWVYRDSVNDGHMEVIIANNTPKLATAVKEHFKSMVTVSKREAFGGEERGYNIEQFRYIHDSHFPNRLDEALKQCP